MGEATGRDVMVKNPVLSSQGSCWIQDGGRGEHGKAVEHPVQLSSTLLQPGTEFDLQLSAFHWRHDHVIGAPVHQQSVARVTRPSSSRLLHSPSFGRFGGQEGLRMSLRESEVVSEVQVLRRELENQKRQTNIAQCALKNTLESIDHVKDINLQLEAKIFTLNADNERLRRLVTKVKDDVGSGATSAVSRCLELPSSELQFVVQSPAADASIQDMPSELVQLRAQYDLLLQEKTAMSQKYEKDYKKWNRFKRWYMHHHGDDFKRRLSGENVNSLSRSMHRRARSLQSSPKSPKSLRCAEGATPGPNGEIDDAKLMEPIATPDSPTSRITARRADQNTSKSQRSISTPSSVDKGRHSDGFPEFENTPRVPLTPTKRHLRGPPSNIAPISPCFVDLDFGPNKRRRLDFPSAIPVNRKADHTSIPTPEHDMAQYARFKGRGRYARESPVGASGSKGDAGFKYDEVVRGQQQRKHLHAGDCDCCHEYYEAIGPLPHRLRPPLWRSPSPSETTTDAQPGANVEHCSGKGPLQDHVTAHKQEISRHRYAWEPPKTPPGYWSIGFPDTQETAQINKEALKLIEQKHK